MFDFLNSCSVLKFCSVLPLLEIVALVYDLRFYGFLFLF